MAENREGEPLAAERQQILDGLKADFEQAYRLVDPDLGEMDIHTSFMAMGADSLALLQISQGLQERFGVKVPFRLLMEEVSTLDALATHLAEQMADQIPPQAQVAVPQASDSVPPTAAPAGRPEAG